MNIYLVGYRGTGKSTVAPKLAGRLGEPWTAVDMDPAIEARAGRSIADIFRDEGEAGFRKREQELLEEWARKSSLVIATGGGVVINPANRKLLSDGFAVWLTADPATILGRLNQDASTAGRRPALTTSTPLAEIEQLLARRTPWYREVAQLTLDTVPEPLDLIVETIARTFQALHAPGGR